MTTPNETPRPMPEPLECTCMSRGNFCWTCWDTIGYDPEEECPSCPVHAGPPYGEAKRLTDASDSYLDGGA